MKEWPLNQVQGDAVGSELVQRFAADLDALVEPASRIGIAVSGGADSLALLLLAAAARPGLVEAATVDHGLRPESLSEAEMVGDVCDRLGVPHSILTADEKAPQSNLQAWARELRYRFLRDWAADRELAAVATAHHLDDQAETLLMRVARGAGVGGLAGMQSSRPLGGGVQLIRPLLGWRRDELRAIVDRSGVQAVDDPSNSDERFDRSRARTLLQTVDWLDPFRFAAVAAHCRDAEEALDWASCALAERVSRDDDTITLDPSGLPRELKRRLLLESIAILTDETPPGPKLIAAMEELERGAITTLAGLRLQGGSTWRLSPAPPRRR